MNEHRYIKSVMIVLCIETTDVTLSQSCDGTFRQSCDPSRAYTNIPDLLNDQGASDTLSFIEQVGTPSLYWNIWNDETPIIVLGEY